MRDLRVWSDKNENVVCIEQSTDDPGNESDPRIVLALEQIVPLIEWLQNAMSDLQGDWWTALEGSNQRIGFSMCNQFLVRRAPAHAAQIVSYWFPTAGEVQLFRAPSASGRISSRKVDGGNYRRPRLALAISKSLSASLKQLSFGFSPESG
jgi:hypothetical protein